MSGWPDLARSTGFFRFFTQHTFSERSSSLGTGGRPGIPHLRRTWWCPTTVGMPLRNEAFGRIPPSRAATITVPVAEDAARSMDFALPPGIFCKRFVAKVLELFEARHPRLGAKVTQ